MPRRFGETELHASLKTLALHWAREQGLTIGAAEVSFPHRRFRVDVAACKPVRRTPSRARPLAITAVLRAAAVFECKQGRGDLNRDNQRRAAAVHRLRTLESRRARLADLLRLHLPHLACGETLFPEVDSYRLRESGHQGYQRLVQTIDTTRQALRYSTKFDRLYAYRLANLHYLVVEDKLMESHEVPAGWGQLVREGPALKLVTKPTWQEIGLEDQLVLLQRIAHRADPRSVNGAKEHHLPTLTHHHEIGIERNT